MAKDLTTCQVDRQNILNNELAITELQKQTGIQGVVFEERLRFTKAMVATYFDVDERTIERYVSDKGARLKAFIKCIAEQDVPDINVGNISSRTSQIALFDFYAFLNVAMLLVESKNAKVLRQIILDIFNAISIVDEFY